MQLEAGLGPGHSGYACPAVSLHTGICHNFCNALPHACRPSPPNCPQLPSTLLSTSPLPLFSAEDFFFRTVHLGTDCWAFIALSRVASAQAFAEGGNWHLAAARSAQVRRQAEWQPGRLRTQFVGAARPVPCLPVAAAALIHRSCHPYPTRLCVSPLPPGLTHPGLPGRPPHAADQHEPEGLPAAQGGGRRRVCCMPLLAPSVKHP